MSGTRTGGLLAKEKNLARDPDFYKKIGSKGGKASATGGFYHMKYVRGNFEAIAAAGRAGGLKSRIKKGAV